jgi:hypothetical protein
VGSSAAASRSRETYIALLAAAGIAAHFALHYLASTRAEIYNLPLYVTLAIGGVPLILTLTRRLLKAEFGSDLLAGISILSSVLLGQSPGAQRWSSSPRGGPPRCWTL